MHGFWGQTFNRVLEIQKACMKCLDPENNCVLFGDRNWRDVFHTLLNFELLATACPIVESDYGPYHTEM